MERLGTLPFVAQPGEDWVYGYSTDVLGCVLERVTGQSLDRVIAERVTEPLGMTDTHFFLPEGQDERLAAVYASGADGRAVRAPEGGLGQGSYVEGPRRTFSGGAGLLSTARDYGRFLEMIRGGGSLEGVRILSPRAVALMRTNQVADLHSTTGLGFGLGFETTDRYGANGMDDVGSYGWAGAYGTIYRIDPHERLVIMLMVQLLPNTTDIRQKFPLMVYQALLDRPKVELLPRRSALGRQEVVFLADFDLMPRVAGGQLVAELRHACLVLSQLGVRERRGPRNRVVQTCRDGECQR
jgi:CubicO group peptidase (beta-lactamase class C family)